MESPSASASSMLCVVRMTMRFCFSSRMSFHTERRFTGSIPVVGSCEATTASTTTNRFSCIQDCIQQSCKLQE